MGVVISIVQTVLAAVLHEREDIRQFLSMIDRMPKIFKAFIGGDQLGVTNVNSIVAIGYQHPLILTMLMINAVLVPTGLLTAQAERGTAELLLSRPITRSRVFWMTAALALASQAFLASLVFAGTAVWTRVFDYGEPIPLGPFFNVGINLIALAATAAAISMLAASWFNERTRAIGVLVAYFVASYLLDFAVVWLPQLEVIHPLTLYNYCRPNAVLAEDAIPVADVAVLGSIAIASLAGGWYIWRERDLYAA